MCRTYHEFSKAKVHERLRRKCAKAIGKICNSRMSPDEQVIKSTDKKQTRNNKDASQYRGSQFRGVSINGDKWQVFVIIKNKKYYAGQMKTEKEAARLYDKL